MPEVLGHQLPKRSKSEMLIITNQMIRAFFFRYFVEYPEKKLM